MRVGFGIRRERVGLRHSQVPPSRELPEETNGESGPVEGSSWFDSSHDLARGVDVTEIAWDDLLPADRPGR